MSLKFVRLFHNTAKLGLNVCTLFYLQIFSQGTLLLSVRPRTIETSATFIRQRSFNQINAFNITVKFQLTQQFWLRSGYGTVVKCACTRVDYRMQIFNSIILTFPLPRA